MTTDTTWTQTHKRVLIADSDSTTRHEVRCILEEVGYDVIAEAESGAQTLRLARRLLPDAIVVDILPEERDSLEVAALGDTDLSLASEATEA